MFGPVVSQRRDSYLTELMVLVYDMHHFVHLFTVVRVIITCMTI